MSETALNLCSKTSLIQIGYGVWVNFTLLSVGLAAGFSAVTIPQLTSNTELNTTIAENAWIASSLPLSAPIGCMIAGILQEWWGRRSVIMLCEVPMCVGWFYIGFATSATDIIIGRVIIGVGTGMAIGAPRIYNTEMSLPNLRAAIGAFANVGLSFGLIAQAVIGACLHWQTLSIGCGVYTAILTCTYAFLPESPYFMLLKDNQTEKVKATLRKFRGKDYNVDAEITELIKYKEKTQIYDLTFMKKVKILFKRDTCKPFWLIIQYLAIAQLSGASILTFWSVDILAASHSSIDAYIGNIILGITRLLSGLFATFVLYSVGRRPLALLTSFGVAVVWVTLAIYIKFTSDATIYPQLCYMIYVFLGVMGYYNLPLIMMYEMYPLEVRGLLSIITISIYNLLMFAVNHSFPYVWRALGFYKTVAVFGLCSFLGFLFLYFKLPETKIMPSRDGIENTGNTLRSNKFSIASIRESLRSVRSRNPSHTNRRASVSNKIATTSKNLLQHLNLKRRDTDPSTTDVSKEHRPSKTQDLDFRNVPIIKRESGVLSNRPSISELDSRKQSRPDKVPDTITDTEEPTPHRQESESSKKE